MRCELRGMHPLLLFAGTVFMGLFAMMNPLASTPIFIGLTSDLSDAEKKRVALKALTLAFAIVAVFSLTGKYIFEMFGITLYAFRIAGGILIFLVGTQMLQGEPARMHTPTPEDNQQSQDAALSIAISPLGIPILAGPGTIATAMSFASGESLERAAVTIAVFALLCVITYALFISGKTVVAFIGESGIKVVNRLMGLLLAVIGTQMLIVGIGQAVRAHQGG